MSQKRKGQESGFALLFVLLAAAMIAIFLYSQMPNVAFEGQRLKEADLVAHGEQYKRAIKLFFRQFGRYPPSIDALENTNNMRFLRRRFKDPMTGKDDWRFIHAGGPGLFTDSLTKKPPAIPGTTSASDMAAASSGSASSPDASSGDPSQQAPQRWQLRRPQTTDTSSGNPDAQPADDSQQQAIPGQPVYIPPGGGALQPGDPGYTPGQGQPGQPLQPGQPGYQPGQPGGRLYQPGGQAYGNPNQPLYPNVPLPGMPAGLAGNQSGGTAPAGSGQSSGSSSSSGQSSSGGGFGMMPAGGGAGIAGVASKYEATGIRIYKDHAKYNEWEFIYDPRDEIILGGIPQQQQPPGDTTGLSGSPGFSQPGGPPGNQPAPQQPGTQPGTSSPN
ncbi:MAG TPA: hypothetical protein VN893_09350 [Bryobacteraceae bacterium]|nr:hypothetical protein [Bryobacteraceae bacterium]